MQKIAAYAALVMAAGLLGLQVVAAVEYTEGGTLYSRASVIAALVTVAALPVFIEAARHVSRLIAVCLFVAFVAMLAYSLPAQVGRAGEVKAAKAAESEISGNVRADLEQTRQRLAWATTDWQQECASGAGKLCRSKGQTVQALEARVEKLSKGLATAPAGDVASDTLSWATGGIVTAETIRRGSVLAFVLGLDVSIWALIWFATKVFGSGTVSANVPAPAKAMDWTETSDLSDEQLAELARRIKELGRPVNNNEVRDIAGWKSKGTASKAVSRLVAQGLAERRRVGREVEITVH